MFSIVMPVYNAQKTVGRAIMSVLSQDFKEFELICVDDASSDESVSVIESFQDARIILIKNDSNKGVSSSRNVALDAASYRYICFLDSDDYWLPNKLSIQKRLFDNGAGVVHSSFFRIFQDRDTKKLVRCKPIVKAHDMLFHNYIPNLTGAYDTKVTGGVVFQRDVPHEDYDMWLRILKLSNSIGVTEPLAIYQVSSKSLSSNKIASISWHYKVLRNSYSPIFSFFATVVHVFLAIKSRL